MMKKNLLLILMCFVCGLVYAHDGLNFRNLDVKSGISDNYVRSVLRDRYGFMWFATLNGLNRYDGYQFKKYTTTQLGAYNNDIYNPQIQISAESETKRSIFREKDKTKRSKKESAQHSKSRNKSFVMTSVSAL